ncbi:hypothetical protein X943_000245 [Babesia divergens]|uniref:Uncharacterized protein n=1 Tax=Babesia divergens TaxID=32595 RepID=A0AAD9G8X1_BABDI|nr:hypothetical protein X943_000245 [Babesia divergens]
MSTRYRLIYMFSRSGAQELERWLTSTLLVRSLEEIKKHPAALCYGHYAFSRLHG